MAASRSAPARAAVWAAWAAWAGAASSAVLGKPGQCKQVFFFVGLVWVIVTTRLFLNVHPEFGAAEHAARGGGSSTSRGRPKVLHGIGEAFRSGMQKLRRGRSSARSEDVCADIIAGKYPVFLFTSTGAKAAPKSHLLRQISGGGQQRANEEIPPLWLFHENSWDIAHSRQAIPRELWGNHPVCETDLFEAEPWLWDALKVGGVMDEFYEYAGDMEPCDQPLRVKSGKLLVRKIVAALHVVRKVRPGTVGIWLDTDVELKRPLDIAFLSFVSQFDITYIPFMSDKQWGIPPKPGFDSIDSPYWRIESGVIAYQMTANTVKLLERVVQLYTGELLRLVKGCLEPVAPHLARESICDEIWFRRNVYFDDIFAYSLALHESKHSMRQGWFSDGCGKHCSNYRDCKRVVGKTKYPYPHVCQNQAPYVSPFNLEFYIVHYIGSGAYSTVFRLEQKNTKAARTDIELQFSQRERFNNTLEFRFPGATEENLQDEYWTQENLAARQRGGLWPADAPLTHGPRLPVVDELIKLVLTPKVLGLSGGDAAAAACTGVHSTHLNFEMAVAVEPPGTPLDRSVILVAVWDEDAVTDQSQLVSRISQWLSRFYQMYDDGESDVIVVCAAACASVPGDSRRRVAQSYPRLRFASPNAAGGAGSFSRGTGWTKSGILKVFADAGYQYVMCVDLRTELARSVRYNVFGFMERYAISVAFRAAVIVKDASASSKWWQLLFSHAAAATLSTSESPLGADAKEKAHRHAALSDAVPCIRPGPGCGPARAIDAGFFILRADSITAPGGLFALLSKLEPTQIFTDSESAQNWFDGLVLWGHARLGEVSSKVHRFSSVGMPLMRSDDLVTVDCSVGALAGPTTLLPEQAQQGSMHSAVTCSGMHSCLTSAGKVCVC